MSASSSRSVRFVSAESFGATFVADSCVSDKDVNFVQSAKLPRDSASTRPCTRKEVRFLHETGTSALHCCATMKSDSSAGSDTDSNRVTFLRESFARLQSEKEIETRRAFCPEFCKLTEKQERKKNHKI